MSDKLQALLTISRDSRGTINIEVTDRVSHTTFLRLEVAPHEFAMAVTGFSRQDCTAELQGVECLGKRLVTEARSLVYPHGVSSDRDHLEQWLSENGQEEGWILSTYLGSQRSITYKDGKTVLNYTVRKYVPVEVES